MDDNFETREDAEKNNNHSFWYWIDYAIYKQANPEYIALANALAAERQAAALERIAAVLESVSGSREGDGYVRIIEALK